MNAKTKIASWTWTDNAGAGVHIFARKIVTGWDDKKGSWATSWEYVGVTEEEAEKLLKVL